MDSGEIVTQQPVSTLPDSVIHIPNIREGPPAVVEAEPVTFNSKLEAPPAQELAVRETPTKTDKTGEDGESRDNLDANESVKKVVDSSVLADMVVVQQIVKTVGVEVDLPTPGAVVDSRSLEGTIVVDSEVPQEEAGHIGLQIEQVGGKSNPEGIAVEVVLNEARPGVNEAQLLPLGEDYSGLGEGTSVEIGIVENSINVPENGGSQHSIQIGNGGYSVETEAVVVTDASATINSVAILPVDELGVAGAAAAVRKELDVTPIVQLEPVQVEEVVLSAADERDVTTVERDSVAVLSLEEGKSIEEPQFADSIEREVADPLDENVIQFGAGDASTTVRAMEDEVLPVTIPEVAGESTADVSNVNAPKSEILEAVKIAEQTLNVGDSSVTRMVGGSAEESEMAAEVDVVQPPEDMKVGGLVDRGVVPDEVMEVSPEDCKIVELDASMSPEEGAGKEDLADLVVVMAAVAPVREALYTGGPLTSGEMDISEEQSSSSVQLDATVTVLTSGTVKDANFFKGIEEEEPCKEAAIPSGAENVPPRSPVLDHTEDSAPVAIGVAEQMEEPIAVASAPEDSNDTAMGEMGEELPIVEIGGLTNGQEMSQNPSERDNSDQLKINETSSLHLVETTKIPDSSEDANVEEVQMSVRLFTDEMETSPSETALNPKNIGEMETSPETAVKRETAIEIVIQTPVGNIQEDAAMESTERTNKQPAVTILELIAEVGEDERIPSDETIGNVINAVQTTAVVKEEDIEMVNAPAHEEGEEGEAVTITKSTVPEGSSMDDLTNPLVEVVIEETTDATVSSTTTWWGNRKAAAEDGDGYGVLIGVGSSVGSRGLTITEIAETTVIVERFPAFSEPLITPPEEEIIESISGLVDDTIVDGEPETTEGLVLEVPEDDAYRESIDLRTASQTTWIQNQNQEALSKDGMPDDTEQPVKNPNDTVVVAIPARDEAKDEAQPLDLQDALSLLTTSTSMETETAADMGILASPLSPPENKQPTDVAAVAVLQSVVGGPEDIPPAIAEVETVSPTEEDILSLPSTVSLETPSVEVAADPGSFPASESGQVSIAMSSSDAEKLSSIDESAKDVVEHLTRVYENRSNSADGASDVVALSANGLGLGLEVPLGNSAMSSHESGKVPSIDESATDVVEHLAGAYENHSNSAEGVSDVVAPSANGLGLVLEVAVDRSVLSSEAKAMESLEGGVAPIELIMESNEKKRGREEGEDVVADDVEKTAKVAKSTSNGEISVVKDAEADYVKIGEDVQLDKKRPRDELETASAEPDVSLQTKAQKTGSGADDAGSLSRKEGTKEETDAEECVDLEDKEEAQGKSGNGAGQPRYKKRKIALFLGYSGAGYQGMQKNPGAITIEGELEEALYRAGAIAESNYGKPQKLDWRRAARTDKGVSAVGQVVSGCFFIDPPGFLERVNSHLPNQIRVYGYKRATASFNAKKLCDCRKYEYVLPVYAFDPTVHLDRETAQALAAAEKLHSVYEKETITTVTKISDPAAETEPSNVVDDEMKEGAVTGEEGIVNGGTDSAIQNPEFEGKEDNQGNGMCTITEEVTAITEITHENGAAEGLVQTKEVLTVEKDVTVLMDIGVENVQTEQVLLEPKEVASGETGVHSRPEKMEAVDEKASIAPGEVLVQTKEVITEREEVTLTETVPDLNTEEKKEFLDEKVKKSTYKFGDAELNRLNKILRGFEGHHNFHNFTARTKATDPSANRYIISFGVEKTFTIDGIEFVRCSVVGQSFMLHQIRKMIGLAVAIMRGTAPESILATALRRDTKVNVPMAPELGLFLEECYYSAYNRRFHSTHEEMSLSSFADEVSEFKKEFIYPHIVLTEAKDSTFAMWLHSLNDRHYPDFVAARDAEKLAKSK